MEQDHMLSRPGGAGEQLLPQHSLKHPRSSSPPPQLAPFAAPPPYAQVHDPAHLSFPDTPSAALPPIQSHHDHEQSLPSFSSLTASRFPRLPSIPPGSQPPTESSSLASTGGKPAQSAHWPSLNPFTAYYTPSHMQAAESPAKMDVDVSSTGTVSAASPERLYDGRASSVSLDDPDVRMAAEALGDLRADFVSSPPNRHTSLPRASPSGSYGKPATPQQEPLFYLLTTSHPLLATTIGGAASAYNNSKNFSPRFKSGAEYVEGYLTPIANTVGSVGRVTGVEGGVRWFLGGRRHRQSMSDLEAGEAGPSKRRKVESFTIPSSESVSATEIDTMRDPYVFKHDRRLSTTSTIDTLPAYDENKSPAYEAQDNQDERRQSQANSAWQSRLIMSTSGLSVAMSEESLRSLKYCLTWLRWANDHMGKVIGTLKSTLEQYEKTEEQTMRTPSGETSTNGDHPMDGATEQAELLDRNVLAARIASLKGDVLKTLKDVIETVSKYAGGALPDNARVLVHRHLTTLPQRFRLASLAESGASSSSAHSQGEGSDAGDQGIQTRDKEMKDGAQRVLVLAKEGLDMMAQVSGVLDGTIVSAEEWCERLGKKRREEHEEREGSQLPQTEPTADTKA